MEREDSRSRSRSRSRCCEAGDTGAVGQLLLLLVLLLLLLLCFEIAAIVVAVFEATRRGEPDSEVRVGLLRADGEGDLSAVLRVADLAPTEGASASEDAAKRVEGLAERE